MKIFDVLYLMRLPRVLAVTAALAGISSEAFAQSADQDRFPDPRSSYLKAAPYISAEQVRRVMQSVRVASTGGAYTGMHKDQVRQELGHPHFDEGIGHNRVWNYIFNLQPSATLPSGALGLESQPLVCQFMVKFNDKDLLTATAWSHSSCAAVAAAR